MRKNKSNAVHTPPFSEVEMMMMAHLTYFLVPSGTYKKDGTAVSVCSLREMLNSEEVCISMTEFFGDAFKRLLDKAEKNNFNIIMAIDDAENSGLEVLAVEGPDKDTVTVALRGSESTHDWVVTNIIGIGMLAENDQQDALNDFMAKLMHKHIYLTGHSLGGNLAVSGAVGYTPADSIKGVYTYNAPGQNGAYFLTHLRRIAGIRKFVTNYQNEDDVVSDINMPVGKVVLVAPKSAELERHGLDNLAFEGHRFIPSSRHSKGASHTAALVFTTALTGAVSTALLVTGVGGIFLADTLVPVIKSALSKLPKRPVRHGSIKITVTGSCGKKRTFGIAVN